jgi:hypothetical protein
MAANANTISVQLTVNDDGSVVMKQFGKNSEDALNQVTTAAPKATSALDTIKSSYLQITIAAAAAYVAIQKGMDYMNDGAKALQIKSSFDIMSESAGANADQMLASLQKATQGTIADSELMQKSIKMMTLGFDPSQIEQFSNVVITASQIAGTTATDAFDRLADAISTRMPRALVSMGAVTKDQMKIVQEAINAGADSTVLFELAIANLELKQKMLQGTQDQATLAMQRFKAQAQETKEEIGVGLLVAMQKLYGVFQGIGAASLLASAGIYKILEGQSLLEAQGSDGKLSQYYTNLAAQYKADASADFDAAKELSTKAIANMDGIVASEKKATQQEISNAQAKVNAKMAAMKAFVAASKDTKDVLAELMKQYTSMYDADVEAATHAAKMKELLGQNQLTVEAEQLNSQEDALNKWYNSSADAINNYEKNQTLANAKLDALYQDYSKKWQKYEDQKTELAPKTANFLLTTNAEMLKEIDQYSSDSIDYQIALINKKGQTNTIEGQNEVLVAKWVKDQISQLTGTPGEGWDSGLSQWNKTIQTEFLQMQDLAKTTATSMSKSFSDLFFDVAKGQTKDFYTYFSSFMDAMLRKVTDNMANMVTQWILGTRQMAATTGGGSTSSLGSLFSGVGGFISDALPDDAFDFLGSVVPIVHSGGIIGETSLPTRNISPFVFAGAPRLHSGLSSDEFPAILQRGEAVIPRNKVKSASSGGNNGIAPTVNITCLDSKSLQDYVKRNASIFQNVNMQGLRDNKTRTEMKKLLQ